MSQTVDDDVAEPDAELEPPPAADADEPSERARVDHDGLGTDRPNRPDTNGTSPDGLTIPPGEPGRVPPREGHGATAPAPSETRLGLIGRVPSLRRRPAPLTSRRALVALALAAVALIAVAGVSARSIMERPTKVVAFVAGPATIESEPGGVGTVVAAPNRAVTIGFNLVGLNAPVTVTSVDVLEGSVVRIGQPLLSLDPAVLRENEQQISLTLAGDESSLYAAQHAAASASGSGSAYLAVQIPALQAQVGLERQFLAIAKGEASAITSPITGTVTSLSVQAGQVVKAGDALMEVVDTSVIDVAAGIQLTDLPTIRPGDRVELAPSAMPGVQFTGRVLTVSPSATDGGLEGTVLVQASNPPADPVPLRTQVFVHVLAPQRAGVAVPPLAVSNLDLAPAVFLIKHGVIRVVPVTVGAADSSFVQILSGLHPGDEVAISNMQRLTEGSRVRISGVVR